MMNSDIARQIEIKQLGAVMLLVMCLMQLPARGGQASRAQIELLSYSLGIVPGQKMRITAVNQNPQGNAGVVSDPLIWRVRVLDADGNQVFQSPEIVTPAGGFRYVDVETGDIPVLPSDTLTGRKQVLWNVILFVPETQSATLPVSAELIDSDGKTAFGHTIGLRHEHVRPE